MVTYALRRLLLSIPVLVAVSIIVFAGVRIIPGDVCRLVLQSPISGRASVPSSCTALVWTGRP